MDRCQATTRHGRLGTGPIVWILSRKGNLGAKPRGEIFAGVLAAINERRE
jgi:hypothetical protein